MTTCGYCGSPLDRPVVNARHSANPRRDLEEIELQISRVQVLLTELIQRRSLLKQEINDRFCPALQLPPEISTEIFNYCLPSIYESPTSSVKNMTPFHLGQICRSWRDFTLSTPRLWSTMCLDLSFQTNLLLIRQWLAYSGRQPLSIRIGFGLDDDEPETESLEGIFIDVVDIIAHFSERLYIIDFFIPETHYYDPGVLSTISDPLPLLTSVSLHNFDLTWRHAPLPIFSVAPRLDEIRLSNCQLGNYYLHLLQVKRVQLSDAFLEDCLAILSSTLLTHCTFIDISEWDGPTTSMQTTHVESLTVNSSYGISELLDHLTAPAMLQLAIVTTNFVLPSSKFALFIRRSSCPLHSLLLSGVGIHGTQLFECLQLIPSLVELDLSSDGLRDEIVRLLAPFPTSGHSQCLLPNLQVLEYKGQINLNSLSISGILLFRWRQGVNSNRVAQLRRVNLKTTLNIPRVPPMLQYQQLVAEGLELSLGTDKESWL